MKHWIRSMSYPAKWLVFITVSEVVFSETISRKTLFLFKPIMEINGYSTFFLPIMDIISNKTRWIPCFLGNLSLLPIRSIRWASQIHTTSPHPADIVANLPGPPQKNVFAVWLPGAKRREWGQWSIIFVVGGLEYGFYDFPYIGNVIIPTDGLIFFRAVGIPPIR